MFVIKYLYKYVHLYSYAKTYIMAFNTYTPNNKITSRWSIPYFFFSISTIGHDKLLFTFAKQMLFGFLFNKWECSFEALVAYPLKDSAYVIIHDSLLSHSNVQRIIQFAQ